MKFLKSKISAKIQLGPSDISFGTYAPLVVSTNAQIRAFVTKSMVDELF